MRAAVTGGAGFIGHHLVGGLVSRGSKVSVIDDFSTGSRSRLAPFGDRVAVTEGSILDTAALDEAFAGCEVVFHKAAIASIARSLDAPGSRRRQCERNRRGHARRGSARRPAGGLRRVVRRVRDPRRAPMPGEPAA